MVSAILSAVIVVSSSTSALSAYSGTGISGAPPGGGKPSYGYVGNAPLPPPLPPSGAGWVRNRSGGRCCWRGCFCYTAHDPIEDTERPQAAFPPLARSVVTLPTIR